MKKLSKIIFGVCFMAITLGVIHVFMNPPAALAQSYIGQLIWTKMCPGHVVLGYPYPDNGIPDSEQAVECYMIQPSYTPTKTPTLTSSPTIIYPRTSTSTPTRTLTSTVTSTASQTPTDTPTPTLDVRPTTTPYSTDTSVPPTTTPTLTPTPTLTRTPTVTPTEIEDTATPSPTNTRTFTPIPTSTPTSIPAFTPTSTSTTPGGYQVVDHVLVDRFSSIPESYITQARAIKMAWWDASVGANVSAGLDCLVNSNWTTSPQFCRVAYTEPSMTLPPKTYVYPRDEGIVPPEIQFNGGLPRPNWFYFTVQNQNWQYMVRNFVNDIPVYYAQGYRVLSFQFSYVNVLPGSSVDDNFFNRNFNGYNIVDIEDAQRLYPDLTILYWTTSLARDVGTYESFNLNNQMRAYAAANNKPLIDMADIESHARLSGTCLYNSYPIICREYTTEFVGGHLGSISEGMLRMGEAVWVMMAQVAGWRP